MKYKYLLVIAVLIFSACKDKEFYRGPYNNDGKTPGIVTDVKVENLPGAAKIKYQLPNDADFWYVEAKYEIRKGVEATVRSSYYNHSIKVEGFGDTTMREVQLFSVDRGQNKSKPVIVHIHPLTPSIYKVFQSLSVEPTFGGALINFENVDSANIAIVPITKDSLNDWVSAGEIYHSSRKEGLFAVRGYDTTERVFGFYVRDRWNNVSDTIIKKFKPIFEQELDKSKFRALDLNTDYNTKNPGNSGMSSIWDDAYGSDGPLDFTTQPGHGLPQWFTFDLGVKARLSRVKVWVRRSNRFLYNSGAVKKWEIWGSNNPDPNHDGSWDTWNLLLTCNAIKPSGLPAGQNTAEDKAFADAGWEFTFPPGTPPVEYLRWKTLENWGNVSHITIVEIELYGQVLK